MKKIKIMTVMFLFVTMVFSSYTSIKANNTEDAKLRNAFIEAGVKTDKVDGLIEKVQNGELIDSLNPEIQPIEVSVKSIGESKVTTSVYPDGSTSEITIAPKANITLDGEVVGGNKTGGSSWFGWTNAEVKATWGVVNCYFHADMNGGYGSATITKVYDYGITTLGGSFSNVSLYIVRANADVRAGTTAEARLTFRATAVNNLADTTVNLSLYLTGSGNATAKLTN